MDSSEPKSESEKVYGIGDLASEFEISLRALRFYEDKGLLSPRRIGNRRFYSEADHTRVERILRGKALGLSLVEIGEILHTVEVSGESKHALVSVASKLEDQRKVLQKQLAETKDAIAELENTLADLSVAIAG